MGAAHITQGWFVLDRHITTEADGTVTVDPATAEPLDHVLDQFSSALTRAAQLSRA